MNNDDASSKTSFLSPYVRIFRTQGLFVLLFICLTTAAFFAGTWVKNKIAPPESDKTFSARMKVPLLPEEHYLSRGTGPYTIITYIDIDCPHCRFLYTKEREMLRERTEPRVTRIIRHFPLTHIHPLAYQKAHALECLKEYTNENTFMETLDRIMASPISPGVSFFDFMETTFTDVAMRTNISLCMQDNEHVKTRLNDQIAQGLFSGVFSTPSFVVQKDGYLVERFDLLSEQSGTDISAFYENQ